MEKPAPYGRPSPIDNRTGQCVSVIQVIIKDIGTRLPYVFAAILEKLLEGACVLNDPEDLRCLVIHESGSVSGIRIRMHMRLEVSKDPPKNANGCAGLSIIGGDSEEGSAEDNQVHAAWFEASEQARQWAMVFFEAELRRLLKGFQVSLDHDNGIMRISDQFGWRMERYIHI